MGAAAVKGLHGGNTDGPSGYLPEGHIVSEAKHAAASILNLWRPAS